MKANEVDVSDRVVIVHGDWTGQKGRVESKVDLFPDGVSPPKSLLTIRLERFSRAVQKNNLEIEKVPVG